MPVVSYASVSESPPLVAVACAPSGFTFRLIVRAGAFSLCLLDRKHSAKVEKLASTSGPARRDKLAEAGFRHAPGKMLGVPLIRSSAASLECTLVSRTKVGEHVLMIARVVGAVASSAFGDFWDFRKYRPILYAGWKGGMTAYSES